MLLFGSISLWAMAKFIYLERHKPTQTKHAKPSMLWDAIAIFFGMIAYVLFLLFHGQLFGFALSTI